MGNMIRDGNMIGWNGFISVGSKKRCVKWTIGYSRIGTIEGIEIRPCIKESNRDKTWYKRG